jgi:sec-independent protein translocase protein TatA
MGTYSHLTMAVGIQELWPIALLVVILFGAKKIPELARGLGSGFKEFKKAVRDNGEDEEPKDEKSTAESAKPE